MLMHLLFLGVAESNFTLLLDYLKSIGSGENTFKVRVQNLLHQLRKFNLTWLLAHPFSGNYRHLGQRKLACVGENIKGLFHLFLPPWTGERTPWSKQFGTCCCLFHCFGGTWLDPCWCKQKYSCRCSYVYQGVLSSVHELDLRVRYELLSVMSGSTLKDH